MVLDRELFLSHFSGLTKTDYYLDGDSLYIYKEGFTRFNAFIKNHYAKLEMEINHKKYEYVLNKIFPQRVEKIGQLSPSTAICIRMSDSIDSNKFETNFLIDSAHFDITGEVVTILPEAIANFNKAIDALYVKFSEKTLSKSNENTVSMKFF